MLIVNIFFCTVPARGSTTVLPTSAAKVSQINENYDLRHLLTNFKMKDRRKMTVSYLVARMAE